MDTIEKRFGFKALQAIQKIAKDNEKNQSKLKDVYNQAVSLPLTFRKEELRMGYLKIFNTKNINPLADLFIGEEDFGIKPEDGKSWAAIDGIQTNFTFSQDCRYLENCIMMAEELKKAAQMILGPMVEDEKQNQRANAE